MTVKLQLWTAMIDGEAHYSCHIRDHNFEINHQGQLTWEGLCSYVEPEDAMRLMRREFPSYRLRRDRQDGPRIIHIVTDFDQACKFIAYLYWMWEGERMRDWKETLDYSWKATCERRVRDDIYVDNEDNAALVTQWLLHYAGAGVEPVWDSIEKERAIQEVIDHLDQL
jgi:hypothetical protein